MLTTDQINLAKKKNKRWKLIGSLSRCGEKLEASVGPVLLDGDDPLAQVSGAHNAICFEGDVLGNTSLIGVGAGGEETAMGLLNDLIQSAFIITQTINLSRRPRNRH